MLQPSSIATNFRHAELFSHDGWAMGKGFPDFHKCLAGKRKRSAKSSQLAELGNPLRGLILSRI